METNQKQSKESTVMVIDIDNVSAVTCRLIHMLVARDQLGKLKYNTSLDRKDLTKEEWCDHMTEELLDAAGYAQCIKRELK